MGFWVTRLALGPSLHGLARSYYIESSWSWRKIKDKSYIMCIFCQQFISAHNVLSTITNISTISTISISIMIWSMSNVSQYQESTWGMLTLQKMANNLISLKNLKMLLTDPMTQGQDWVRGDAIASRKKYFQKSQFYKVEFVYGAVFLVCIISSKKCLNKISCLKAWGQRTHFWHSRVITVYYVHIVHKPNKKIKIHGWY